MLTYISVLFYMVAVNFALLLHLPYVLHQKSHHNCHSNSKLLTAQTKMLTAITNYSQLKPRYRPDRKRGCLEYRGFFSPSFINPYFRYSPIVNIENLDFTNPRFSNIYLVNNENCDFRNPRFSNIRVFDIH